MDRADTIGGLDFFTPARLHGVRGTCRYLLRDYEAAASFLESALAERREVYIKGRAMLTFDLAECRIHQGETEEGCRLGHDALDLVSAAAVEPGILRAQALRRCLAAAGRSSAVTALSERMRELRMYAAVERTG